MWTNQNAALVYFDQSESTTLFNSQSELGAYDTSL
jgi:hypothetical protein